MSIEQQVKEKVWEKMKAEHGEAWVKEHSEFLEAQWEWALQLGMIDPEVDL